MDAIKHDKQLDIATGVSRKTKTWKNKSVKWSELLSRLECTTRTPETMAEYKAMKRDQQSDIKDVGGFVGGYCNEGSRSNTAFRSVLCLDADFADAELWPDWQLLYGNAAAVYSTHKHTPKQPRLRLVVPLSRNVTPDEYQAIGRRVADNLGIDKFDDTSYQPQRVMFWPSTSQDGEYFFRYIDAPLLDPDTVLATYHNWQDVSSWPMSSRVSEVMKKTAAKQKDPLEKSGLVGAFCRAYTITEAIEAFVPEYVPCDEPGRYTYTEGSTAAGIVIYDDKYSYSHHATDPASSQLCNAWDLVRLHKFKDLDADTEPGKQVSSLPSYKAMSEMAVNDSKVKIQILNDRTAEAMDDFEAEAEPVEGEEAEEDTSWKAKLKMTEKGAVAQTIENVVLILKYDTRFKNCLAFNEMNNNIVIRRSLPWRGIEAGTQWTDTDDAALRYLLERAYGISGKDRIFDAVNVVAQKHSFHPVRDYLTGCTWDGVQRVDTLLIDYLGAEDNEYTRAVTRKTLVAAVARVYRPGIKFDNMLTVKGRQGIGKSTIFAKLAGEWFSDSFLAMQGKDSYEQLHGVWIMEVGELAGMRKAEAETIKQYISKQSDRFRPAYGRRTQEFPRQCIFVGTTNEAQFLRDTTGNRRFWVVDTPNEPKKDLWKELTADAIQLIWAEAVALYKQGEKLFLSKELEETAREIQAGYEEENPNAGLVIDYLERLLPQDWDNMDLYARKQWLESDAVGTVKRTAVCAVEILTEVFNANAGRADRYATKEVNDILKSLPDWKYNGATLRTFKPYGRQRHYIRRE